MATLVQVVGQSGSGKTTAIRNLNPDTTFLINSDEKDLPIRGWETLYSKEKGNYATVSKVKEVLDIFRDLLKKDCKIKTVIIDTVNRIMTNKVMEERNIDGYKKWADLSGNIYDLMTIIKRQLPPDIVVFALFHEDIFFSEEGIRIRRIATEGQQLKRINLESMSAIVLFTRIEPSSDRKVAPSKYFLQTQSDGFSTGKTPMGMFKDFEIPNDYNLVLTAINEYNK
ncbi:MAG: AAA family ATPase [Nanoarchaeota archaeon]